MHACQIGQRVVWRSNNFLFSFCEVVSLYYGQRDREVNNKEALSAVACLVLLIQFPSIFAAVNTRIFIPTSPLHHSIPLVTKILLKLRLEAWIWVPLLYSTACLEGMKHPKEPQVLIDPSLLTQSHEPHMLPYCINGSFLHRKQRGTWKVFCPTLPSCPTLQGHFYVPFKRGLWLRIFWKPSPVTAQPF